MVWLICGPAAESRGLCGARHPDTSPLFSLFFYSSTGEAIHLGSLIAAQGYVFPISDHVLTLKDDGTFYRFQVGEPSALLVRPFRCPLVAQNWVAALLFRVDQSKLWNQTFELQHSGKFILLIFSWLQVGVGGGMLQPLALLQRVHNLGSHLAGTLLSLHLCLQICSISKASCAWVQCPFQNLLLSTS